jgi:hypothetical protein
VLGILLLACLFVVSLPFEAHYTRQLQTWAHNPAARFVAGLALVGLAWMDPILGALAFLVLFLWIADIQLLSSIKLPIT